MKLEAEILQLEMFGMGSFNTSSHFLARSLSQVYHLKTTDVLDSCEKILNSHNCVIIDPVQKWVLESEIACMSGSKSISNHGIIVSKQGELLNIDCNKGIHSWKGRSLSVFPSPYAQTNSPMYSHCLNVETTHHSQQCYLSKEKILFHKDLRSSESAQALFSTPHFITTLHVPSSVSHSTDSSSQFFLGIQDMMYIMDSRFCKSPLAMRPIPGSPSMIRSLPLSVEELGSLSNPRTGNFYHIRVNFYRYCL